ncbi:hypothetical protein N8307_09235 [Planktomarina temperata]|nr:hypothetical protein [bacterium]MDC1335093.1 hypothetical protein [Planktomarina temperata]
MIHTRQKLDTSERRTCAVLGVSRSSLHYKTKVQDDDALRLASAADKTRQNSPL